MGKAVRTTVYFEDGKAKELKKKAIDAGLSFSEFLARAGTQATLEQVENGGTNTDNRGVPSQG